MITKAFVLIETTVGKTGEVATNLKQLEGVKSVDPVTSPYDVIAIVEGEGLAYIGDLVTSRIHPIPNISRTVTCICMA